MSPEVAEPPRAPEESPPTRDGVGGVLLNGPFLRLWMSQAVSQTAQQTINFALLIQVRRIILERGVGGANTLIVLLILMFATPPIFLSAIAGVLVDRSNKRTVMAGVNGARAVCIAGYLFLRPEWSVLTTLGCIYALCFAFSCVGQLFGPAEGSTIPLLVPEDRLINANALFSLTFTGSQLLGFFIFGPLLTEQLGLRTIYVIVVLLYLLCTLLILSLPSVPPADRAPGSGSAGQSIRKDLREVLGFIARDRLLLKAIAYLTVANSAFLMIAALAPEYVGRVLVLPPERLATVLTPAGVGMVAGVIIVGRIGRHVSREILIDRALIVTSLLLTGFSLVPPLLARPGVAEGGSALFTPPVIAAMILASALGIANAFIIVPSQTLLQERSNERIRARVLSAFFTASNAMALIPLLLAGILGDLLGVVRVLVTIALLALAISLSAEWSRSRRPPTSPLLVDDH